MQGEDVGRTFSVHTPEDGSWSALHAYSNPPEYTYYTQKLLERRVADEIAFGVLSSFVEETPTQDEAVAHGHDDAQDAGSQPDLGAAMGAAHHDAHQGKDGDGKRTVVHIIRRKRRRPVPNAAEAGHTL